MTYAITHHDHLFFAPLYDAEDASQRFADAMAAALADRDEMTYLLASLLPADVDCEAVMRAAGVDFASLLLRRFPSTFVHAALFGEDVLTRFEALVEDRAAASI